MNPRVIIYYDKKSDAIVDFFPNDLPQDQKHQITQIWMQPICREIIRLLTQKDEITAPVIQAEIGHSMSTLHENIKKLEQAGIIVTEMVYTQNKQKIIRTNLLAVSKNTKMTESITRFLNQGLWVDSDRSKKVVKFLEDNNEKWFTVEDISAKTGIQVDEVQTLLDNWDSFVTRAFSDFMKQTPFEKRQEYRARK